MGNEGYNKYTWVIKNFSSLNSDKIYSDEFVIGGCKWCLMAYPKGNHKADDMLCLYLVVANAKNLPYGWRRHAKFSITVFNQIPGNASKLRETQRWFDHGSPSWGFQSIIPLGELKNKNAGFLVNGKLHIVVEVHVVEVFGILDVPEKSDEARKSVKKIKLNDLKETPADLVDLNGFHVLPSQVEIVSRIFKKHPDISIEFRSKNRHLRTACMNVLLSLIETLCQSPQELSNEDLVEADNALAYVKEAGFKVDWLEKQLTEVKEKKEEEQTGETQMQELEEELKGFKQKCSDIEALLEEKKAKVLAARAHLTLYEFL